jgi:hypothetical protein
LAEEGLTQSKTGGLAIGHTVVAAAEKVFPWHSLATPALDAEKWRREGDAAILAIGGPMLLKWKPAPKRPRPEEEPAEQVGCILIF